MAKSATKATAKSKAQAKKETKAPKIPKTALDAVAIQCDTTPDQIEYLRKDDGIPVFGYKGREFKVLMKEDFNNTKLKSWRIAVKGVNHFVYLLQN